MLTLQKTRHGSCCDPVQFFRARAVLFFHPSFIGISILLFLVFSVPLSLSFFAYTREYIAYVSLCRLVGRVSARADISKLFIGLYQNLRAFNAPLINVPGGGNNFFFVFIFLDLFFFFFDLLRYYCTGGGEGTGARS